MINFYRCAEEPKIVITSQNQEGDNICLINYLQLQKQ